MTLRLVVAVLAALVCAIPNTAAAATLLVKADGTGDASTIQDAVNAANSGDTVLLAPGTYTGAGNRDVDFSGKAITISSQGGAAVTIIDCQGLGRGFVFTSGEKENSVLSGVTIMNGSAANGGGVYAHVAKPTIIDNVIVNNTATEKGGGIYVYGAVSTPTPPVISGNTITGNTVSGSASERGGGLWISSTAVIVEDNTISGNTAGEGGGLYLDGSNNNIARNNVFTDNTATALGGGLFVSGYTPSVADNTFLDNHAGSRGGGVFTDASNAVVERCLLVGNSAGVIGGGAYFREGNPTLRNGTVVGSTGSGAVVAYSANLTVEKTIIAFNPTSAMLCFTGSSVTVSCSDLFGNSSDAICGTDGGDNFSRDPMFCDAVAGDYHLLPTSHATQTFSPCGQLVGALEPCLASGAGDTPRRTALFQNFPNPFNPRTTIRYQIVEDGARVSLRVYDVRGRLVRTLVDDAQSAGVRTIEWDGTNDAGAKVASGIYLYRLTAPGFREVRKMILLK